MDDYYDESSDDELPCLGKRLQLGKSSNTKFSEEQYNQKKNSNFKFSALACPSGSKDIEDSDLGSTTSLENAGPYLLGNKRQCDKNAEQIGNPKRTCQNDISSAVLRELNRKDCMEKQNTAFLLKPSKNSKNNSGNCENTSSLRVPSISMLKARCQAFLSSGDNSDAANKSKSNIKNIGLNSAGKLLNFNGVKTKGTKDDLTLPSTSQEFQRNSNMHNFSKNRSNVQVLRGVQFIDSDTDSEDDVPKKFKNFSVAKTFKGGKKSQKQPYKQALKNLYTNENDTDDEYDSWSGERRRHRPYLPIATDSDTSSETQAAQCKRRGQETSRFKSALSTTKCERPFTRYQSRNKATFASSFSSTSQSNSPSSSLTSSSPSESNSPEEISHPVVTRSAGKSAVSFPSSSESSSSESQSSLSTDSNSNMDLHIEVTVPLTSNSNAEPRRSTRQRHTRMPCTTIGFRSGAAPRHIGNRNNTAGRYLSSRFPDIFDDESTDGEFYTANSANSDSGSNRGTLESVDVSTYSNTASSHLADIHSSSDEEVSVIFSASSSFEDGRPTISSRWRRSRSITNRSCGRNSITQRAGRQALSGSPDPVEQVRQMEEDEQFARMLQAQFDAEVDPHSSHSDGEACDISFDMQPNPTVEAVRIVVPEELSTPRPQVARRGRRGRSSSHRSLQWDVHRGRWWIPPVSVRRYRARRQTPENPWMWQFAHMLGIGPSSDASGSDYEMMLLQITEDLVDVPRGLVRSEVNRLPTRKYIISGNNGDIDKQMQKECQVCLSDYENGDTLRILPCFHEFHTMCIDPWLKINRSCPVCRVEVNLS